MSKKKNKEELQENSNPFNNDMELDNAEEKEQTEVQNEETIQDDDG